METTGEVDRSDPSTPFANVLKGAALAAVGGLCYLDALLEESWSLFYAGVAVIAAAGWWATRPVGPDEGGRYRRLTRALILPSAVMWTLSLSPHVEINAPAGAFTAALWSVTALLAISFSLFVETLYPPGSRLHLKWRQWWRFAVVIYAVIGVDMLVFDLRFSVLEEPPAGAEHELLLRFGAGLLLLLGVTARCVMLLRASRREAVAAQEAARR